MKVQFSDHMPASESRTIRREAQCNPTRRLSQRREHEVPTSALCLPFDIKGASGPARLLIGEPETGYFQHTVESALPEFDAAMGQGIKQFCLRPLRSFAGPERAAAEHAGYIAAVRRHVGPAARLVVDPFSLALNHDLTWGVLSATPGVLDVEATLDLIATAAVAFGQAGADAFLTLGRVPYEARVARAALDAFGLVGVKVVSFSTNSETPNAYINARMAGRTPHETGQKILVGNGDEMVLRALLDIDEGTDEVIHKPIEGVHVVATLHALLAGELKLDAFLGRPRVAALFEASPALRRRLGGVKARFAARAGAVRLGTYTVSGTYSLYKTIEHDFGGPMAFAMLDELYGNALAAGGEFLDTIIDRNALWFLRHRQSARVAPAVGGPAPSPSLN